MTILPLSLGRFSFCSLLAGFVWGFCLASCSVPLIPERIPRTASLGTLCEFAGPKVAKVATLQPQQLILPRISLYLFRCSPQKPETVSGSVFLWVTLLWSIWVSVFLVGRARGLRGFRAFRTLWGHKIMTKSNSFQADNRSFLRLSR